MTVNNDPEPLLVFMHVSKTGGTTLQHLMQRQYAEDEIFDHVPLMELIPKYNGLNNEKKQKLKMISGHYVYGAHKYFDRPVAYFAMLREPVDRVLSLYYFLREHPNPEIPNVDQMSLEEFIHLDIIPVKNYQVFHCSGDPAALEEAKANIEHHFPIVGLTEAFNESVFLMKRQFSWDDIRYSKKNVTKKRLPKRNVPQAIIQEIRAQNALDLELYRFVKRRFYKQLRNLSREERRELVLYKKEQIGGPQIERRSCTNLSALAKDGWNYAQRDI